MRRCARISAYDFCRTESEKNPFVAGPLKRTDCSLVSDGAAAIVLADVETALRIGRAVAFRADRARAGLPADVEARHPQVRGLHARPGSARSAHAGIDARRSLVRRDARLLHHRRADRIRGDGPRCRRARARARSRKAGRRRTASCRSIRPAASRPRATRSARPACRCMRCPRCSLRGEAGDMQVQGRQARRHLQHGRRGGGELRQRSSNGSS